MQIFLTGATGFLGNNLLRQLLDDGHDVTVSVRHSSPLRPLDGLEVDKREIDLADPKNLSLAVAKADLVIHAAAMIQIGWSKLEVSRRVNVDATRALAEAVRRRGVRMVYVSTVDALAAATSSSECKETDLEPSKPECTYVVSKREAEQAFLAEVENGLDGILVNPGFMVGPWDWKPSSGQMMLAIANQFVPFAPSGGCSVVDVRDAAAGIIAAYDYGKTGERYILGGHNLTYLDLWKRMAKVVGSRPPVGKLPKVVESIAGFCGDMASKVMPNETQVNSAATKMGGLHHWYSSEKAAKELGYKYGEIEAGLEDAWQWFKRFGYVPG